jgi:hypothetical protein
MLNEKKLTKAEQNKREELIMKMKKNKRALVQKYGKDAEQVMYGRATNIAKKLAETDMEQNKLREMVKAALMNSIAEKKGKDMDGDGDVDSQDYLATKDAAIKKAKGSVEEGTWSVLPARIPEFIQAIEDLKNEYHAVVGDDDVFNGLDAAISAAEGLMSDAPLNESASSEEKRIALRAIKSIAKYRGVSNDEAKNDLIRAAKEINDLKEDLDLGHEDNEPHMLKADLYRIGKYAMELYQVMDGLEGQGEVDLPHWWQSKIVNAKDALVGAKHYLDFEMKEPEIDAMVNISSEEEVIDEEEVVNTRHIEDHEYMAAKIQKAMNGLDKSSEDYDSKLFILQKARKANNKGDFKTAMKIMKPFLAEVNELLDSTPLPVVAKANSKIVDVPTMAKSLLDIYNDFKEREKIDFESNSYFKNAINFLTKAAQKQIDKETKATEVAETLAKQLKSK